MPKKKKAKMREMAIKAMMEATPMRIKGLLIKRYGPCRDKLPLAHPLRSCR